MQQLSACLAKVRSRPPYWRLDSQLGTDCAAVLLQRLHAAGTARQTCNEPFSCHLQNFTMVLNNRLICSADVTLLTAL